MTGELTIITNNHKRDLLYWYDLTDKERAEFDWIDASETDSYSFFRYKDWTYCLSEFMHARHVNLDGWDGVHNDTFFSGVLVKYPREDWGNIDTESVIVGWYYC